MGNIEISKKGIILSLIAIALMIGFINSASALYAGESETIILEKQYEYYSIVGNLTPIYLNITQEGLIAIVTINKYQKSDNFTIIFFNKSKETIKEVPVYSGGGGSGGSTKYVDKIVEIPKFYDRNITTILYEDNKIIEGKIIYEEKNSLVYYILIGILGIISTILIVSFIRNRRSY